MRLSNALFGNNLNLAKILVVFVCFLMLIMAIPVIVISDQADMDPSPEPLSTLPRTPRGGESNEPNNNFNTAEPVVFDSSGLTNFFNCTVGGVGDPVDYWRFPVDRGTFLYSGSKVIGAQDSDKLDVQLSFNGTGAGGVRMFMYDAEFHEIAESPAATKDNYKIIEMTAQVNPYIYLKVESIGSEYNYALSIANYTDSTNYAYTNHEKFSTAIGFNLTQGKTFSGSGPGDEEYLDGIRDCADFYKFDATTNQKIEATLTTPGYPDDDFDIFLYNAPTAGSIVASSEEDSKTEDLVYYSPGNNVYYLRVAVKNEGQGIRNRGYYTLVFNGNIPPRWNDSFPDTYSIHEDDPPYFIGLDRAFYDLNPSDQISIEVLDYDEFAYGPEEVVDFPNATIELLTNNSLKITPKPNKFGYETITVQATDIAAQNYTKHDLYLKILPTNDLPILNGTNEWTLGSGLIPDNDGEKITCDEGTEFVCTVTAYDPVDPWDIITFDDNSDIFDIEPTTGVISFTASYHYSGTNIVEIIARDNGTAPNEMLRTFRFIVVPRGGPVAKLTSPDNNVILDTLNPKLTWEQTNVDFFDENITYELFLSSDKDMVESHDKDALNASLEDIFEFQITEELADHTTYYWTVIPNDGIHSGSCESGVLSFDTNVFIPIPKALPKEPYNNQMLDKQTITLIWEVDFSGTQQVYYDVYLEEDLQEVLKPNTIPRAEEITALSYKVTGLPFENYYYWRVVPFYWENATRKVQGPSSEVWSLYVTEQIPRIELISPKDNSLLLPTESLKLTWKINHTTPKDISCKLFWGTSQDFIEADGIDVGKNTSYVLHSLSKVKYYWKVVPYLNTLRGTDSPIWDFELTEVKVPKVVLLEPLNTTLYQGVVELRWKVEFDGDPNLLSKIKYDIYLDKTTDNPEQMQRVDINFPRDFYTAYLVFEENVTYYWYVIPQVETKTVNITGICTSGVASFAFGIEGAIYQLDLVVDIPVIKIKPDSTETVYFTVRNLGNRKTTVDISVSTEPFGDIFLALEIKTSTLNIGEDINLSLDISTLPNAEIKNYNLTITARSQESTVVKASDEMSIVVVSTAGPDANGDKEEDTEDNGLFNMGKIASIDTFIILMLIIVIVIVVILLFLFVIKKKPTPPESAQPDETRAPMPVQPAQPASAAPIAPLKPVQPIQPIKPIQPVQPIKPVTPAQAIKPVKPVSAVKPVIPVAAQAVKPTPAPVKPAPTAAPAAKTAVTPVQPAKPT